MDKLAVRVFFGSAMLTIANEIWTFFFSSLDIASIITKRGEKALSNCANYAVSDGAMLFS